MLTTMCLALAIYYEARSEPLEGQLAVAEVILNRVDSNHYPNDVCDVVYQPRQFSFTHDGKPERPRHHSWEGIKQMAEDILDNPDDMLLGLHATHYHANYVSPHWANDMFYEVTIGNHIFYVMEE